MVSKMGWFREFMDAGAYILYGVDTKKAREEKAGRRSGSGTSNRNFPADNGTVDGQPAYVKRSGSRTDAYSGPGKLSHVVTNDGENASYVRNDDGEVVVDDQSPDPYNPRPWKRH